MQPVRRTTSKLPTPSMPDARAQVAGRGGIDLAIAVLLVVIVAAAVLPDAFSDWYNASADGFGEDSPGMIDTLWNLVPIFAVLALVLYFYNKID